MRGSQNILYKKTPRRNDSSFVEKLKRKEKEELKTREKAAQKEWLLTKKLLYDVSGDSKPPVVAYILLMRNINDFINSQPTDEVELIMNYHQQFIDKLFAEKILTNKKEIKDLNQKEFLTKDIQQMLEKWVKEIKQERDYIEASLEKSLNN